MLFLIKFFKNDADCSDKPDLFQVMSKGGCHNSHYESIPQC